jgi:hypothetical protein
MPGGLTLMRAHDADIETPASGKVTVFFSIEQAGPAYKDDTGLVFPLEGPTGAQGPSGTPGFAEDGLEGESYPIVAVGPQGNTGAQGLQGPAGPMGLSESDSAEDRMIETPLIIPPDTFTLMKIATLNITDAQFKTLNTVPLLIIPPQGAGTIILPIYMFLSANVTVAFSATVNINTRYVGGTATGMAALATTATTVNRKFGTTAGPTAIASTVDTGKENVGIELFNSAGAGPNGTTSGGYQISVAYIVQPIF